ncbi:polysaccharide pyruvyl transferase family protein [Pseudooctadecabacter sp.]|uniref:polysaccharide pyruvyl transferase family protein n=1 Tax=Pseudooctadecabacter sp. TaxID=1966338 RepID=UPI0025E8BD2C|nr:polysaccharide pyruvyl transferase family protein [Pseudooctadecabacter sp.]
MTVTAPTPTMRYQSPLRLFWYRKEANFGDGISAEIVSHVSGRDVRWSGHASCEMYALGSLMRSVATHQIAPRETGRKPFIWGTGTMTGLKDLSFLNHVRVALLRGPITAALLQREDRVFGDTGLLIADAAGEAPRRDDIVGLVPHMHYADDPRLRKIAADNPRIKLIDVRDEVPMRVVREIASCSHIISQSLHGLVTADAFGIPNTWLDPMGIHAAATLKFYDYAAGIGRALQPPITAAEIEATANAAPTGDLPYVEGILQAKEALYASFPRGLVQEETA